MDKKLTDKEIVKALEIFVNSVGKGFVFANVDIKKDGVNEFKHIDLSFDEIFDLINRLQAENERLSQFGGILLRNGSELFKTLNGAKAEAYKEFANELKCRTHEISYNTMQVVNKDDIDNLLKELVGEGDA